MTSAQTAFLWLLGLYWVSAVVAGWVFRVRAGLNWWRRIRVSGPGGVGVGWTTLTAVKAFGWPVVLAIWAATGKPEPRIVFNDKALAREHATEARRREAAVTRSARPVPAEPVTAPIQLPRPRAATGAPQPPPRSVGPRHAARP